MKCIVCHSEDIELKWVEEEIKHGKDIFLVKIEASECNSCGERYYSEEAVKKLEKFREKIRHNQVDKEKIGAVYRTKSA